MWRSCSKRSAFCSAPAAWRASSRDHAQLALAERARLRGC